MYELTKCINIFLADTEEEKSNVEKTESSSGEVTDCVKTRIDDILNKLYSDIDGAEVDGKSL